MSQTASMQSDKIYDTLLSLGLSMKEARVYLSLLQLGRASVSKIARLSNINRTTAYDILDRLVSIDLVSSLGVKPRQEYLAEIPQNLATYAERQLEIMNNQVESVRDILPALSAMHTKGDRPIVKFYEGVEGLKHVYEDTLSAKDGIRGFASVEDTNSGIPNYFPKYYKRRAAGRVHMKAILTESPASIERSRFDKQELRETRLVPKGKYDFVPELNIYDDKVMIASWNEKLGVTIQSQEIADSLKKLFDLAWEEAKRLGGKKRAK